jgi:hypothetical protein
MPVSKRWVGWYRAAGGQWQPAVRGATYDETWRLLLDRMGGAGRNGEWVVLPAGTGRYRPRPVPLVPLVTLLPYCAA